MAGKIPIDVPSRAHGIIVACIVSSWQFEIGRESSSIVPWAGMIGLSFLRKLGFSTCW